MKKIYVLELEDGCYYVGESSDIEHRYNTHARNAGSEWTKLHKPLGRDKMLILDIGQNIENPYGLVEVSEGTVTHHLMCEKGFTKVRGYAWCQRRLNNLPVKPKNLKYFPDSSVGRARHC